LELADLLFDLIRKGLEGGVIATGDKGDAYGRTSAESPSGLEAVRVELVQRLQ